MNTESVMIEFIRSNYQFDTDCVAENRQFLTIILTEIQSTHTS